MLLDNSIKPALEDALTRINTITFEGAKLLELYLLDKLDKEVPDQIPIMDYNFIRKLFQAVSCREGSHSPQRTSDESLNTLRDNHYANQRPLNMQWMSTRGIGQIISLSANQYLTNCRNHVSRNLPQRLCKFINFCLHNTPEICNKLKTSKLVNLIYKALVSKCDLNLNIDNVGQYVKNIEDASQQCLNYILELYNEIRNFVGDLDFSKDAMDGTKSWQNYLPLLYEILKIFED